MRKSVILTVCGIALLLLLGAIVLNGGIYEVFPVEGAPGGLYLVNKFTGHVSMIRLDKRTEIPAREQSREKTGMERLDEILGE